MGAGTFCRASSRLMPGDATILTRSPFAPAISLAMKSVRPRIFLPVGWITVYESLGSSTMERLREPHPFHLMRR